MDSMVVQRSSPSSNGGLNAIRAMIMVLVMVVFVGYLLLWLMTPTNVYRQKWLPKIRADANSTFFGAQGPTILLYTFPILFIAVLGCVYLHLGKKSSSPNIERNGKKHKLAIWRRPVIIKVLGIVSRIELAFFVMFMALLVWSFSTYLRVSFAKITPQSAAKQGEKVWEAKLDSAALRLGLVGNLCLAFLFFPVTRGSSVLPLFGLTSEASVKYHIWLGHIVMTLFTAHGLCYIIYWAVTHQLLEMLKWDKTGVSNVAGELALLAGLAMWVTTFPRIRRKMFELFFYTHYLYILFIAFFIFHVGISYSCMMLPGFYLFVVDRFLRFLQSRQGVRLVSARVLPCEVMELNFSKARGLSYTPTSIMFMNVPGISKLQWHPFTISSSSNLEPEKLSVIIKSEGSWSKKLYQMLSSPSSVDHLDVSIEGPYGPASTNFLRHDTLVMVSGGSGITPFISIFRDLIFTSETVKCKTPQILLICAFKNTTDLTMLDLLLPISSTQNGFSNLHLQIEAYVTRDKEPKRETKMPLQNIWFKPNSSDSPISPILGPNSWIWLGAIISSSLIIFLLFMGILTRYYIYPIDHNTNQVYSYSSRAVLNILLICISIAVTASAAFYWNKKQGARETNQVQNMEGTTPVASPSSWVYNADREMESFPQQSLVQSTNVHYGERPDLKRILFERKESSIGVLVCGPKKMRHEVASICSAGLAENLHFESISFSW
ncbi:Ferric reduction oxidase [Actinidia chinensis var. chinensis]|uniref:ferric-chelate reductase (NADH) n=1 Tax=Actinidia chinensis var. chinensis TaxID=1590841 RepID=A0A2R6QP48_ACTCC|nr:Ferric reduction oxidase [Actinidia chinensis var. chinensis]